MDTEITQLVKSLEAGPTGQVVALQDEQGIERAVIMAVFTFEQMQAQMGGGKAFSPRVFDPKPPTRKERKRNAAHKRRGDEATKAAEKARRRRQHEANRARKLQKKMPKRNNYLIAGPSWEGSLPLRPQ